MLPPAALIALSLYAGVIGPVCQNPAPTAPSTLSVSTVSAPPVARSVAEISTQELRAMALGFPKPVSIAARSVSNQAHVSVGDYTTQAQVGFSSVPAVTIPTEGDVAVELSADEAALLAELNEERTSRGLNALDIDPQLVLIAREHSEDMCRRNYFDHLAPEPGPVTPMDRYLASLGSRPDYAMVGENIYYRSLTDGITQSATEANDAFMHSPGHRANVLQPLYTKVGIGIYRDRAGEFWVTEMFLRDTP